MFRPFICSLTALLLISVTLQARVLVTPISSSLGGAGVASIDSAESFVLNPASIVHNPPLVSGLFWADGMDSSHRNNNYKAFSVVDNSEGIFLPGGFLYSRNKWDKAEVEVEEVKYQLGLAAFLSSHISLGVSFRHLSQQVQESGKIFSRWNGDLGLLWNPSPQWAVGLVYYNLVPEENQDLPPELIEIAHLSLGLQYLLSQFSRMRFEIQKQLSQNSEDKYSYHFGLESYWNDFLLIRFGGQSNHLNEKEHLSVGVGFDGPRLKLNYSYLNQQGGGAKPMHSVDFSVTF